MVAMILTIIEAAFALIGVIIIWAVGIPAFDRAQETINEFDTYNYYGTTTNEGLGFAKDFYIALAVTFTIILVLLIIFAVLIYKYRASLPAPPRLPLRVIQPATGGFPNPGYRF